MCYPGSGMVSIPDLCRLSYFKLFCTWSLDDYVCQICVISDFWFPTVLWLLVILMVTVRELVCSM